MKSAEVVLVLAFVLISSSSALDANTQLTNDDSDGNSITEPGSEYSTVTINLLEDATKTMTEDDSTVTKTPTDDSSNETVTTDPPVTTATPETQKATSNPNEAASVNQTSTPAADRKRLSTEIETAKCESLGIEIPKAENCKCYKQKSAGTDTPQGFCYYYECAGNPPTLSKHKCEWIKE